MSAACSQTTTGVVVPATLGPGRWGSPNVGLEITATTAAVRFAFCADGTMTVPIALTPDGRFDVSGTYVRNVGPSVQARSARYVGLWRGRSMTLTVVLSDKLGPNESDVIGPYDLILNAAGPPITPCPL
jgi:hypothetical protein